MHFVANAMVWRFPFTAAKSIFRILVGTEDVLRWSPVVWLLGVCVAGTFMNLVFYCQKKYRERKRRQRDQQEELLFSLAIPRSYPCLAPPPHHNCCRATRLSISDRGLPSYEDAITHKLEDHSLPPNYSDAISMMNASTPVSGQLRIGPIKNNLVAILNCYTFTILYEFSDLTECCLLLHNRFLVTKRILVSVDHHM
ncbi:hypothetical protein COOONC_05174 [Cooperia oncophora]